MGLPWRVEVLLWHGADPPVFFILGHTHGHD